jgi:hypothetical protein
MHIRDFSAANKARSDKEFPSCADWPLVNWMNAAHGELGEASNVLKKMLRGDYGPNGERSPEFLAAFGKELHDALAYIDLAATCAGLSLETVTIQKWNEVSERIGSSMRIDADGLFNIEQKKHSAPALASGSIWPRRLNPDEVRIGMLVRYANGETALAKIASPHAGGWHAHQCMGGMLFVSANGYGGYLYEPTQQDIDTWNECKKWRTDFGRHADPSGV